MYAIHICGGQRTTRESALSLHHAGPVTELGLSSLTASTFTYYAISPAHWSFFKKDLLLQSPDWPSTCNVAGDGP